MVNSTVVAMFLILNALSLRFRRVPFYFLIQTVLETMTGLNATKVFQELRSALAELTTDRLENRRLLDRKSVV